MPEVVNLRTPPESPAVAPLKLGERIREIRRANGWTLETVSQKTGLARSTISKIENGQMSPTFEAVQKLAAGLGMNVPQLFEPAQKAASSGRRAFTSPAVCTITSRPRTARTSDAGSPRWPYTR